MADTTNCPFCGGVVNAGAGVCAHCGGPLKSVAPGARPALMTPNASQCPNCSAHVAAGDIVCVQCGTNLLTGQKVAGENKDASPAASKSLQNILKIAGIFAIGLTLVIALGFLISLLLRDPVGEARRLALAGNLGQAAESLQRHLERAPNDTEAAFLLGRVYWSGQQYARAAETFESVARQAGTHERDAALLAFLAAERTPESSSRQRMIALLRSMTQQRYASDGELLSLLALLQGMEREYRGQRETVEDATLLDGEIPPVLRGLALALDQDTDTALRALQTAAERYPQDMTVAAAQGFVQLMGNQAESAATTLARATELEGNAGALVKLQLGMLHMQRGEYGKALSLLTEAKNAAPDDMRAAFCHALCLQENKLLDEALVAFERISTTTSPFAGPASLQMAVIYTEQNALDRAAAMARRASEVGMNTARQATVQGRIFALQGELGQAEQAYRRAVSMTADYPAARLELGLLLINRGAVDAGLQELQHYLELAKTDPARYRANEIEVLVTQIRQTRQ